MKYLKNVLHCTSSFEGIEDTAISYFISYCFTLAFTSTDITLRILLELHLKLSSAKRISPRMFLF